MQDGCKSVLCEGCKKVLVECEEERDGEGPEGCGDRLMARCRLRSRSETSFAGWKDLADASYMYTRAGSCTYYTMLTTLFCSTTTMLPQITQTNDSNCFDDNAGRKAVQAYDELAAYSLWVKYRFKLCFRIGVNYS